MPFQLSPGVLVKEIDLTNIVPAVATSIGGMAGAFQKGPVGEIVAVGSWPARVLVVASVESDSPQAAGVAASQR